MTFDFCKDVQLSLQKNVNDQLVINQVLLQFWNQKQMLLQLLEKKQMLLKFWKKK